MSVISWHRERLSVAVWEEAEGLVSLHGASAVVASGSQWLGHQHLNGLRCQSKMSLNEQRNNLIPQKLRVCGAGEEGVCKYSD